MPSEDPEVPDYGPGFPNFDQKKQFLQPQTPRARAAYLSPLDSEALNLSHNTTKQDLDYLYSRFESIDLINKERFKAIYEDGITDFIGLELPSLTHLALELQQLINKHKNEES